MFALIFLLAALGPAAPVPAVDPVVDALRGATVAGVYEDPVELVEGRYEGAPFLAGGAARPTLFLVPFLHHEVDLDGDREDEVVAYLEENSGGTGHLLYVASFEVDGDSLVSSAVALLGDREQIRSSRVEGRRVVVELIAHGPRDAGCCPTQWQRRTLELDGAGSFVERREVLGVADTSLLDGTAWRLVRFSDLGPPVEGDVTLNFDGGRVYGDAGCNRYEATFESPRRRELVFGPAIATRRACDPAVMDVESAYLDALSSVLQWNYLAGRLALLYPAADGGVASLIFEPK